MVDILFAVIVLVCVVASVLGVRAMLVRSGRSTLNVQSVDPPARGEDMDASVPEPDPRASLPKADQVFMRVVPIVPIRSSDGQRPHPLSKTANPKSKTTKRRSIADRTDAEQSADRAVLLIKQTKKRPRSHRPRAL